MTDGNGCTDSSSVFVDVFDNIYPVAIVQNITVFLNQSGFTSIDVLDIDNGSYDNCGIDTMYINLDSFKCSDVGENLVSFTVVDSNSNSVTTSAFVNVLDTTLPLIDNCPSEIFDEASSNCGFTLPDYTLFGEHFRFVWNSIHCAITHHGNRSGHRCQQRLSLLPRT